MRIPYVLAVTSVYAAFVLVTCLLPHNFLYHHANFCLFSSTFV